MRGGGTGRTGCEDSSVMVARLNPVSYVLGATLCLASIVTGLLAGLSPAFALAAAFGAGFVVLAFANLTLGLVLYMVVVFLQFGSLAKTLLASALLLVLAAVAKTSTARAAGTQVRTMISDYRGATLLFLGLLGWVALSATWAGKPADTYVDVVRWAINIAVYFVVVLAAQTRGQVIILLGGYIATAAFVTVVGPAIRPDFLMPDLSPAEVAALGDQRFIGGLGDPNELATVLLPALALSIGAIGAPYRAPGLRLGACLAAVICLVTLFLTSSRGGLIGLGVSLIAALIFAGRWRGPALFGTLTLLVCVFTFYGAYASQGEQERILAPTQGEGRAQESRLTIWQVGWRVVEAHPAVGVGAGNYEENAIHFVLEPGQTFRTDAVVDDTQAAHNTYLHVLAELGVVGFGLFTGIIVFSVGSTMRAAWAFRDRGDVQMEIMARTLTVGQVGMLASIFFFSAHTVNKIWLVLAFGPALLGVARTLHQSSREDALTS